MYSLREEGEMTADAKEKLMAAANAVSSAVMILKAEMPAIEAFMRDGRTSSETNAIVAPLFKAAIDFVRAHDEQAARNKVALDRVKA